MWSALQTAINAPLIVHSAFTSTPLHPRFTSRRRPPFSLPPLPPPPPAGSYEHWRRIGRELSAAVVDDDDDDDWSVEKFTRKNVMSDFIRLKRGAAGAELQTAVVCYQKRDQPSIQVDLVTAIHVADKQYFDILQRGLGSYERVLYEGIARRVVARVPEDRMNSKGIWKLWSWFEGFDVFGFIGGQTARFLSFDFQEKCLDYAHGSWQNADLDYETYKLLQEERGESFYALAKVVTQPKTTLVMPSLPSDLSPRISAYSEIDALFELDIGAAMKIFFAKQLTSVVAEMMSAMEEGSVIIGERNRVAAEALKKAIDGGNERIAVLYGVAHMPDLGRRLREELDMIPSQVQWVTAWSIKKGGTVSSPFLKRAVKYAGPLVLGVILGTLLSAWLFELLTRDN